MPTSGPDLMFVQHGDYREAFHRLNNGGEETYLDQRRSVDFVADLSRRISVAVVSATDADYDEMLTPTLRAIGISKPGFYSKRAGADLLAAVRPASVIPRTPHPSLLEGLQRTGTPSFPMFADTFRPVSWHSMVKGKDLGRWRSNRRLRHLLSGPPHVGVANHSLNASLSVESVLRLPLERIVPWEWTRLTADPEPRMPRADVPVLLYAGVVSEEKGVGDLVEAVRILKGKGVALKVVVAGAGPGLEQITARAERLGLTDEVEFLGRIPRRDVSGWMRRSDISVVPSRLGYPEGMPNVIYEALAARTPVVLSDHPAFRGRLVDGNDALFFASGDAGALSASIERALTDEALYRRLSGNAPAALDRLYVGRSWYDLVERFVGDPKDRTGWVARHSLAAVALG